jgi:hypothetical protein
MPCGESRENDRRRLIVVTIAFDMADPVSGGLAPE